MDGGTGSTDRGPRINFDMPPSAGLPAERLDDFAVVDCGILGVHVRLDSATTAPIVAVGWSLLLVIASLVPPPARPKPGTGQLGQLFPTFPRVYV